MSSKPTPSTRTGGSKRPRSNAVPNNPRRTRTSQRTTPPPSAATALGTGAADDSFLSVNAAPSTQTPSSHTSPPSVDEREDSSGRRRLDDHHHPETIAKTMRSEEQRPSHSKDDDDGEDDDDDNAEALQRFSNTSLHPRRTSHPTKRKTNSPPQLSSTPPPSPPQDEEGNRQHTKEHDHAGAAITSPTVPHVRSSAGVTRSHYTATEGGFFVRVSPPAVADTSRAQDTQAEQRQQPTSLLSELLIAEAERAGAVAAANEQSGIGGGPLLGLALPLAVSPMAAPVTHADRYGPSQDPPTQYAQVNSSYLHEYASSTVLHTPLKTPLPFTSGRSENSLGPLAVHIGVMPLPGTTGTTTTMATGAAGAGQEGLLPWVRALASAAVTSSPARQSRHAATPDGADPRGASGDHAAAAAAKERAETEEAFIERLNVRYLHPRRLLTRGGPGSSVSTPSHSFQSPWSADASGLPFPSHGPQSGSAMMDIVGWAGLFTDVPILLRGARTAEEERNAERRRQKDGVDKMSEERVVLPPGAQVCVGAATVQLMLD